MYTKPPLRVSDKWGEGHYGASRGSRTHNGEDRVVDAGDGIHSHIDGVVTKIGLPYAPKKKTKKDKLKSDLRYIQVTDGDSVCHRFFYVDAVLKIGDPVEKGTLLGYCQDLEDIWPEMLNHCHYEVKINNQFVDPNDYI